MNCRRKQHAMTIQALQEAMGNNKLETFDLKRTQCGPDAIGHLGGSLSGDTSLTAFVQ